MGPTNIRMSPAIAIQGSTVIANAAILDSNIRFEESGEVVCTVCIGLMVNNREVKAKRDGADAACFLAGHAP